MTANQGSERERAAIENLEELLVRLMIQRRQPTYRNLLAAGTGLEGRIATMRMLRAINALAQRGTAPSVREVAERLGIEQSNASRTLDYAVERNLVAKGQSEDDRRRLELTLTDQGRSVIQQLDARRNQIHGDMLKSWPHDDVVKLGALLERLCAAYDELAR
jgi:DNA-binding MarR family transcriptional regulator